MICGVTFMFSVGDTIIYATQGICTIKEITTMKIDREKKDYFVLCPVFNEVSSIYVPVDSKALLAKMRTIISSDEIEKLLTEVSSNKLDWIDDENTRKEYCAKVIKSGNRKELLQIIEMLYSHQLELKQTKKHFHISDERFLKEAEKLLHDEFSYVLGIKKEDVPEYIKSRINA